MAPHKPVFRFVGKPAEGASSPERLLQWTKLQLEVAQMASVLFSLVQEKGTKALETQISQMKDHLRNFGVKIAKPAWFAQLLDWSPRTESVPAAADVKQTGSQTTCLTSVP